MGKVTFKEKSRSNILKVDLKEMRLTHVCALLTLIYLYKQETSIIIANENIWSKHLVNLLHMLPKSVIFILLVLYVIILLKNIIFSSERNIIIYLISLYILVSGAAIAIDTLNLQDITNLGLFNVYHPIFIDDKVSFHKCGLTHYPLVCIPEIYTLLDKLVDNNNLIDYNLLKDKSIE